MLNYTSKLKQCSSAKWEGIILKKERIVEAARKLFTKYGYKKVSMDEIAKEAGVTKKTVYAYFKDKDELFQYFVLEEVEKMKSIVKEIEDRNLPFLDMVHQTIYVILKHKKQENFLVTITNEADALKNPKVIEAVSILDTEIKEYIKGKLVYAMENGYMKKFDVNVLAYIIYKLYISLMFEWDMEQVPLNEKEITDNILEVLKNGILK